MSAQRWGLVFLAGAALVCGAPAGAQYMYLDSNGDGVWTTADVMNANGTATSVDVYLITSRSRDGSEAVCNVETAPLTMNSYVVNLKAVDGTVAYEAFVNRQPMPVAFGEVNPGNGDYKNGFGGGTLFPPGEYRLCTLTIRGLTGTPSIQVVDIVSGTGDFTSFGTRCSGLSFDNTYKLDGPSTRLHQGLGDWFDADGLGPGSGVPENDPPSLTVPENMTVASGESARWLVSASDPDGQFLQLDLVGAPGFTDLTLLVSDRGAATAELFAAPWARDVGQASGAIRVSDGEASSQATFQIRIPPGPNHAPWLGPTPDVLVPAGATKRVTVHVRDVDGQAPRFGAFEGPSFATPRLLASRDGAGTGYIELTPGTSDGGTSAQVRLVVTDEISITSAGFAVHVPGPRTGPDLPDSIVLNSSVEALAIGDLNGDGKNDIVTGNRGMAGITVLLRTEAGFAAPVPYPLRGEILDLEIADLNGDGWNDVVAANFVEPSVPVWLNSGNGALQDPVLLPLVASFAQNLAVTDLNGDNLPDLIVPNGGFISVYMGSASGLFLPRRDWTTGAESYGLAVDDFALDGRPDVLASSYQRGPVMELLGRGGGEFRTAQPIDFDSSPFRLVSADFNSDGFPDVATSYWTGAEWARVVVRLGDGAGAFQISQVIDETLVRLLNPDRFAAEDIDLDGNPDLVVMDWGTGEVTILRGHGNGTFGEPLRWAGNITNGLAVGDLDGDGWAEGVSGAGSMVRIFENPFQGAAACATARAFTGNPSRAIPVGASGPNVCLRFEPVDGGYANDQVDLSSFVLSSMNTGSVGSITCIEPTSALEADQDGNGVSELPACFARSDLAMLFDRVHGRSDVTATLTGRLVDGSDVCASVALTIVRNGPAPGTAYVTPNPFNPRGVLHLTTSRPGALRVRVFDIQGRLVRTLVDRPLAELGTHQLELDGRDQTGRLLGSGVYFYVAETASETLRGRFAILK